YAPCAQYLAQEHEAARPPFPTAAEEGFPRGGIRQNEFPQREVRFAVAGILARRRVQPPLAFREISEKEGPVLFRAPLPLPRGRRIRVHIRRVGIRRFPGGASAGLN